MDKSFVFFFQTQPPNILEDQPNLQTNRRGIENLIFAYSTYKSLKDQLQPEGTDPVIQWYLFAAFAYCHSCSLRKYLTWFVMPPLFQVVPCTRVVNIDDEQG